MSPTIKMLLNLLLLVFLSLSLTYACPAEVCICKWKGGKQTVECGSQQLPHIPEGMDPGTQVLNFSGNSLQVLQSERFLRMDLLNLQKIYLSRNQLIRIHEKAFRGLTNLVELDLSDNSLQNVPSETFQDYSSLMRLTLSGNPIRELKTSGFRHLSFLTTLELSNCQIERVENEAFVGMDNLEWLRLDGNRISFIQGAHILPKSLHGISLHSNRWACDCRLLDMHAWLVNFNTPMNDEPKCFEPARLKGQVIKTLKKDELACPPEVSPESTYTEVSEGRNMTLSCVVRAIPEPKVLWLFNGQVMTNESFIDNLHMYYYIEDSSSGSVEEKRSEIFIYNVGADDNGTFSCVGMNIAGTTFSNYTLRVIIKEPPVVNEVSFPRDYMNYIVASSMGGGVIFIVLLCTIVVKCKQREDTSKRKKCGGNGGNATGNGGVVTSIAGGGSTMTDGSLTNDSGMLKCASIITDGDSLNGHGGGVGGLMMGGDSMTPTKLCKENGGIILGGQMKQNLLLYAPAHQQLDSSQQSLHMSLSTPPPQQLMVNANTLSGGMTYCSPPQSMRNYQQEKNPDLVNDAESVKHKLKATSSLDGGNDTYDAASDCSGPCSIPVLSAGPTVQYDNCYQITPQFTSQIMHPGSLTNNNGSRFNGMSTLPRGMHLKSVMQNMQPANAVQQVDVHLNPVCFLGQDSFTAFEYSTQNGQMQQTSHHHLQLQPQHSLGSGQQQQSQQQQQQQNFYRTLPHNRAHKQQQFAAAHNSGMRYSLEAELLQRSSTPTSYEKYLPNVRFTAEGYPQQQQQQQLLVQYPSPPEGYKTTNDGNAAQQQLTFQQWPPCLPGYHAQPIHFSPAIVGVSLLPNQHQSNVSSQTPSYTSPTPSNHQPVQAGATCGSGSNGVTTKRLDTTTSTIPECDENDISPTASTTAVASAGTGASSDGTAAAGNTEETTGNAAGNIKHLNGPLADSPDEGYVGDSHEGSDI